MTRLTTCTFFLCGWLLVGLSTQLSSITFCIGDEVVYNCTVNSLAQTWTIPAFNIAVTISPGGTISFSNGIFSIGIVVHNAVSITTLLSVVSFAGLNGTVITCRDALQISGEFQETTAMVFGFPSAPGLTAMALDLQSLNFNIFPWSEPSQCVLHYNITPISSDGNVLTDIVAVVTDSRRPVSVNGSGFDLCNNTYSFTVVAVTLAGLGVRSAVVNPQTTDLLRSDLIVSNSEFRVTVKGIVSVSSTASILRSSPNNNTCVQVIVNEMRSGSRTITETLNCRFAGRTVTYCLQFSTEACQSNATMRSTKFNLPGLLASPPTVLSSTSDSFILMVDVNEQSNCAGVDQLRIVTTITNSAGLSLSRETDFNDTTIMFGPLSPDVYICSISVVDGTEQLETRSFPCGNITGSVGSSSTCTSPVVVGVVCSIFFLTGGVIIGVLATVLLFYKCKNASFKIKGPAASAAPPPPLYEEVETVGRVQPQGRKKDLELQENVAYGYVQK